MAPGAVWAVSVAAVETTAAAAVVVAAAEAPTLHRPPYYPLKCSQTQKWNPPLRHQLGHSTHFEAVALLQEDPNVTVSFVHNFSETNIEGWISYCERLSFL